MYEECLEISRGHKIIEGCSFQLFALCMSRLSKIGKFSRDKCVCKFLDMRKPRNNYEFGSFSIDPLDVEAECKAIDIPIDAVENEGKKI